MNEELSRLAQTDSLTGLSNRRKFDLELEREIRRSGRTRSPLSLIMLDVNYFKFYNDACGHVMGDDCLRQIATVLRGFARRHADLVARYGGEEFMLIFPDTRHDIALKMAEEIRRTVENLNIAHPSSLIAPHITVSQGVITAICDKSTEANALIDEADKQLYLAKMNGRNSISDHELLCL